MERRSCARPVELRAKDDGTKELVGYAAVFYRADDPGTEYQLWSDTFERIDADAFSEALKRKDDAVGLFNHDPSNLLGRVSAGTLQLKVDKVGLFYAIPFDESDPDHQRVERKLARGDVPGSSFQFRPQRVRWEEEEDREIRTLLEVELIDVGPVTHPAYRATTAANRNDALKQEHDAWKEHRRKEAEEEQARELARVEQELSQADLRLLEIKATGV